MTQRTNKKNRRIKKRWILTLLSFITPFLLFSTQSTLPEPQPLSPAEAKNATQTAKHILRSFSSNQTFVQVELNQTDLNAIGSAAHHTLPALRAQGALSSFGAILAASYEVNLLGQALFINVKCELLPEKQTFELQKCQLGHLPVPAFLIKSGSAGIARLLFGEDAQTTVSELFEDIRVTDSKLVLTTTKKADFKENIKSSIHDVAEIARTFQDMDALDQASLQIYLDNLDREYRPDASFLQLVNKTFQLATTRSTTHDPVEENTAALWALAIQYGNPRFARMAGLEARQRQFDSHALTLRGREDIRLHFLYSIVLAQVGRADFGLQIGEFKEILDANRGGSGYSFTDLAADKAGLKLSEYATAGEDEARQVQHMMANATNESVFMPLIHDLPEGLKAAEFSELFGNTESDQYKQLEKLIDQRIDSLSLYGGLTEQPSHTFIDTPAPPAQGQWLKVDLHMHTKYSDGRYSIPELAEKAHSFGCNVIAITDHGDENLKQLYTPAYFEELYEAQVMHHQITIMPGLEWNIPPFKGREHAVVLLPKLADLNQQLVEFRQTFDNYSRYSQQTLSAVNALRWLESKTISDNLKPAVFYEHPSRKDAQHEENKFDMLTWRRQNNIVLGFSGAPGHQKLKGEKNGSYNKHFDTIDGWDPAIARVGGEWDQLLQLGYRVLAAKSPSDYHGQGMDYWPCEFSSTHLFSASNRHNDVLKALRSGQFWAQQGQFVESVEFTLQNQQQQVVAQNGQALTLTKGIYQASLAVTLNDLDWQGNPAHLDQVEIIIIKPNDIEHKIVEPQGSALGTQTYQIPITIDQLTTIRWRGISRQAGDRDYLFYTNPIMVEAR